MGTPVWQINQRIELHWRQIDGEWLVFEGLTGATHLLDPLSAGVLMCFESGACLSTDQLLQELSGLGMTSVSADAASKVVGQFGALGMLLPAALPLGAHAVA